MKTLPLSEVKTRLPELVAGVEEMVYPRRSLPAVHGGVALSDPRRRALITIRPERDRHVRFARRS